MAKKLKTSHLAGVAGAAISLAVLQPAAAQQGANQTQTVSRVTDEQIASAESVVVIGEIAYRNRTEETAPVLEYGLDFFQRFEPLTAGDALKRVPSVTFLSDVIESDGARMRGLDPGYTQILINGEQVPGSNDDRSFFMDRIPAELIERVEVVRSASANRSGDALAGALNIVLRDGYSLDGGYVRLGALAFDDGRVRESAAAVWGGAVGGGRLLLGGNVQGRRNPKVKQSLRFGDSPENDPDFFVNEFDNREDQLDTRNGTDYSFNGAYDYRLADGGRIQFGGFYVHTDRTESEYSVEYDDPTSLDPAGIETIVPQVEDIIQDNYSLNFRFDQTMFGGENRFRLGFAEFKDDIVGTEEETEYDPFPSVDDFGGERELTDNTDRELTAKFAHQRDLSDALQFEFGVDFKQKERETSLVALERGDPADPFVLDQTNLSSIEETRVDPFVMVSGDIDAFSWEAGVRYETTDVDIAFTVLDDAGVIDDEGTGSNDYALVLPSAHLHWDLTMEDRVTFSVARTVRRPNFNFLNPLLLDGEFGDNDFVGNPMLEPETAWGGDIGYERRIGNQGIFGVNFFYRQVEDLIELFNTGDPSEAFCEDYKDDTGLDCDTADPADFNSFVLSARNTGDGKVWGVEFDLSTPLDFVNLPDTGVFLNYSWLDSEVTDEIGERRFNDQADYVFNVGFIHDMPSLEAAFGVTFRKQGDAFGRIVAEEVTTSYGEDLEIFVEKSFGENFTLRFVGSNLLDASKDEVFNKFDTLQEQIDRDFDEYELETEKAGPVFRVMGRYAF